MPKSPGARSPDSWPNDVAIPEMTVSSGSQIPSRPFRGGGGEGGGIAGRRERKARGAVR